MHKLLGDVHRERRAYLADAVLALPKGLRAVVIGYFCQARVSQLRAEALILLRDGLNAHLDPDTLPAEAGLAAPHSGLSGCSGNGFACPGRW